MVTMTIYQSAAPSPSRGSQLTWGMRVCSLCWLLSLAACNSESYSSRNTASYNGDDRSSSSSSSSSGSISCPAPHSPDPIIPANDAVAFALQMGIGWNLGNSLEAIGGETAWGNPLVDQELITAIKNAGFDTIRIPVAWSKFSDPDNFIIDSPWMNRVEQVVNYALTANMYVIMNIHWDGGWMNHPTYANQASINNRLSIMWGQIASRFQAYDHRLLFAGTNEVMFEGDFGTPTEEYYTVQNSFNQTFVTAVRATGDGDTDVTDGNANTDRYLVVQGFNTNINHTVNFADIPADTVAGRLMMEVHYYDPFNFTLNNDNVTTSWPSTTETWANESWVDSQFQKMKTNFVDLGIPVILGEYSAMHREDVVGHENSRICWNQYVTNSAVNHGMVPVYWDAGFTGQHGSGLFNRNNGDQVYPDIIDALVTADDD
jgi:endoglucanase